MASNSPKNQTPHINSEYFSDSYVAPSKVLDLPLAHISQRYDKGSDTGLNRHEDFYALYIVNGGRGIHIISDHPYNVARGDVYIALPGSYHAYRDFENLRADCFCFQTGVFSAQQLEALRSLSGLWNLQVEAGALGEVRGDSVRRHRLHLGPERHREVEAMIGELREEIERRNSNPTVARTLIPALFLRLLVYLARAEELQSQSQAPTSHDAGLAQVLRICEERFAEPLSVPQLAATMFLSPGRFSEVFSAHMGVAPATYIRRLRLERAQTLLRTTDRPAAIIALEVGFNDAAQFSRAFRAAFGVTPSDYRGKYGK